MPRYIDADALKADLDAWTRIIQNPAHYAREDALHIIDSTPTADVVPVVRGEWIVTDAYPHRVCCSLCFKTNVPNEEWLYEKNDYPKYCMWCGAKMDGERRESEVTP